MYVVFKVHLARWLSWLERRPVTAEVEGSSPFRVVCIERCRDNFISHGIIAQLGEHLPYKQGVIGSSPIGPILIKYADVAQFVLIAREGNMKQSRLITNQLCKIFRRCGSIGRAADL